MRQWRKAAEVPNRGWWCIITNSISWWYNINPGNICVWSKRYSGSRCTWSVFACQLTIRKNMVLKLEGQFVDIMCDVNRAFVFSCQRWNSWIYGVRGEIHGFTEDELLQKHWPRMFSLMKNESVGIEDD